MVAEAVAVTPVGAPGTAGSVICEDGDEAVLPIAFIAVTVNVKESPGVKDFTVAGLPFTPVSGVPGVKVVTLYGVTVYEVIGLPFEAGAVKLTVA